MDFKKRLSVASVEAKIDPIDIYQRLDRKSETGPLRPAQEAILNNWYKNKRNAKDVILKLHTGQGKTLIGLLILQSRLNEIKEKCIYVCPDKYLVKQTCEQADRFGIKYCTIEENGDIPEDFLNSKKILITNAQKIFNGKSKFGLYNKSIQVSTIILDDSHACIDVIKSAYTLHIKKDTELYSKLINIFAEDLKAQGEGSYLEICDGEYSTLLQIPYWSWISKKSLVLNELSKHKNDPELTFIWPLIKDRVELCQAFISGNEIEISPYLIPISDFGTFSSAKQRILMSATTLDDSFFIKGLGIEKSAIQNPLIYIEEKWSGEKMLLIPSLIDDSLDRYSIINYYAKPFNKSFGLVSLVPSFVKSQSYKSLGAKVADASTIYNQVDQLKTKHYNEALVIVNRYDGIDLPDDTCRLLIIDSMPFAESLNDRYEERCRKESQIMNIKMAQKVEQGLGRSVRGEKDYSVIIILGGDLVSFMKSIKTRNFFSKQTKKQIDIGLEIAEGTKEEIKVGDSSLKTLNDLVNQCINRDEGWIEFYFEKMNTIDEDNTEISILDSLFLEYEAEIAYSLGEYSKAVEKMQKLLDGLSDQGDRGWFQQFLARYKYNLSEIESITLQHSAFKLNQELLKPKDGINYSKINAINDNRIQRIKLWINKFENYSELGLDLDKILDNLSFGELADRFEASLKTVGEILGFLSQRPDKELGKGPDNLWCIGANQYILFECKNEVDDRRSQINKTEVSQMNTSFHWFEQEYPEAQVTCIMIIPTRYTSPAGYFGPNVLIMKPAKLNTFKKNIKSFFKELNNHDLKNVSEKKIQELLNYYKFDIANFEVSFTEPHKRLS